MIEPDLNKTLSNILRMQTTNRVALLLMMAEKPFTAQNAAIAFATIADEWDFNTEDLLLAVASDIEAMPSVAERVREPILVRSS